MAKIIRRMNTPNKLNHKLQTHALPRFAKNIKRKRIRRKNDYLLKYFVDEGSTLEGCRRTMTPQIQSKPSKTIVHNIKVLVV